MYKSGFDIEGGVRSTLVLSPMCAQKRNKIALISCLRLVLSSTRRRTDEYHRNAQPDADMVRCLTRKWVHQRSSTTVCAPHARYYFRFSLAAHCQELRSADLRQAFYKRLQFLKTRAIDQVPVYEESRGSYRAFTKS